jgi:hypothetical protein
MGGYGSGNSKGRGLQSLDGYLTLDLNTLLAKKTRRIWPNPNSACLTVQWGSGSSCQIEIDLLNRRIAILSSAGQQEFALISADLTFGQRWFFLCSCGRRARKVYFRFGKFGCRDCRRLMFPSQTVSGNRYWFWRVIQKNYDEQHQ